MSKFNKALYIMILKQSYPRILLRISNKGLRLFIKGLLLPYFSLKALYTILSPKVVLRGLELQITEKCTLRCKDCSILIPFIPNPKHKTKEAIFEDIDKLLELVDLIPNIRVIGGEVILHPDLNAILEKICCEPKIETVSLITNGTMLFNDETINILKNKKVYVLISDYGKLSRKLDALVAQLKSAGVQHTMIPFENWVSFGSSAFRNYKPDQLKKMYNNCEIKFSCIQLFDNKLTPCARAENLYNMGVDNNENTFGFLDISRINSKAEMGIKLKEFYAMEYISACNYCDGGTDAMKPIPAAIQINRKDLEGTYESPSD